MKKISIIIVLLLFLCGCDKTQPEYLISSMGFDYSGGKYIACFEAVVINSENTDQTVKLLKGEGSSIKEAVSVIKKKCTQPLLMSHCGVIAVSENMPPQYFKEVCDFCYNKEEITLSAFFIKTSNPQELLSIKPLSSVCVGYDIMGLIKQNPHFENRFFEVINSGYKARLPKITQKDGGLYFEG
ncbi:MAG: hypothetical protein IKT44_01205 [Clostridia bacterium]|nr:hypothetical protein [Clostridia bacterium]